MDSPGNQESPQAAGRTQFAEVGMGTSRRQRVVAVDMVTEEGRTGYSLLASEHRLGKEQHQGVQMEWACLAVAWDKAECRKLGSLLVRELRSEEWDPSGALECWELER